MSSIQSDLDPGAAKATPAPPKKSGGRWLSRFGPAAVALSALVGLLTLLVFAGYTPIAPTDDVVLGLFLADVAAIVLLASLLFAEGWGLYRAYRSGEAGARLHARIVGLFSIIAALPAILIAVVGSVTLERALNPAFMQDVRGFIYTTADAARLFRESQCRSLLQETRLTASDLDRGRALYNADRSLFHEFMSSRIRFLGFSTGVLMSRDGTIVERADNGADSKIVTPEATDFEDAKKDEPQCLILDNGLTFVALREMHAFPDTYLYTARRVDPFTVSFPAEAANLIAFYDKFDQQRRNIQLAFATMYSLLAMILLLSATWIGLSFAKRLVDPIRRLIAATDQVASGNLYVQVPVRRSEGDLAHLGETFNKMTSELRLQQNRLIAASSLIDERRVFTEAVLSGVPAAVIGVDSQMKLTVLNPYAERLLGKSSSEVVGHPFDAIVPEIGSVLADAENNQTRVIETQTTLVRSGRERMFNVRVSTAPLSRGEHSFVVTLDDITDLVTAQRTSAWADVARRIAHEIKNPLTPIQLSAERLKRKYSKVITEDRAIFDQCTDTIVRQVDDIKRMVDEFSSFARMPKARPEVEDVAECVRQVLFLMRVGHPDITFDEESPDTPLMASFDRRLLSQALTNIVKNATEGIAADTPDDRASRRPATVDESEPAPNWSPRIVVKLEKTNDGMITLDVMDNGKGFPSENRQRLLEPYMTTREEGTGLGLPIVAKILEDHGGGIELRDAPGGGAWVRLYFPIKLKSAGTSGAEPDAAAE